jgi:membrane protein implicated in regulation of membrane protease activity
VSRTFVAKAWLGGGGASIALAGMATERRWLVWIAVALLSIAFLLRFVERKSPDSR